MSYTVKSLLPATVIHDAGRPDSPSDAVTIIGFDVIDTSVLAMTVEGKDGQLSQFPLWPTVRISTQYGESLTGDQLLMALVQAGVVNEIKPPKPRVEFHNPPPQVRMVQLGRIEVYTITAAVVFLLWVVLSAL